MCFESDLDQKKPKWQTNVPKGPKKVQKRPIMWTNQKQKDGAVLPKAKLIVYIGRSQKKFLILTPNSKFPFLFVFRVLMH